MLNLLFNLKKNNQLLTNQLFKSKKHNLLLLNQLNKQLNLLLPQPQLVHLLEYVDLIQFTQRQLKVVFVMQILGYITEIVVFAHKIIL